MIRIPTGRIGLDKELDGGLPLGSIVEVFGPPDCGKTHLALNVCWKTVGNRPKLYLDCDFSMSGQAQIRSSLDGRILLSQPETAEQAVAMADRLLATVDVIVFDTVASLITAGESEGSVQGKEAAFDRASLLAAFLRRVKSRLRFSECLLLLLNHEYEGRETPGGKAVHELSQIRIRLHGAPREGATIVKNVFQNQPTITP